MEQTQLYLPLEQHKSEQEIGSLTTFVRKESILQPWRILVVDDEESVASTLQANLKKLPNCQVAMATSGEQALQLFERQSFNLLITDYKMPGMNGLTLATRVRQLYPKTAIVVITAYGSDDLRDQATRAFVCKVLDKPVQIDKLRAVALEALDELCKA